MNRCEALLLRGVSKLRTIRPVVLPDLQSWRIVGKMPKAIFLREFEPVVRKLGCPPTTHILAFQVALPFDVRVQRGTAYTARVGSNAACTVTIHRAIVKQRSPLFAMFEKTNDEPEWEVGQAVAELVGYVSGGDPDLIKEGFSSDALSAMFDLMLGALNTYLAGYLFATRDIRADIVGIRTLHPVALYRLWEVASWDTETGGLMLLSATGMFPASLEPINDRDTRRLLHGAQLYETKANPFVAAELHLIRAEGVERDGDHRRCVIEANTGIEVFLSALYRALASEDGVADSDIENRLDGGRNFLSVVTREFHPRLGGRWDLALHGTPIGDWHKRVYLMRCRAVHGGHHPKYEEAVAALDAAINLRSWIVQRVAARKKKYPKTAAFFVGPSYEASTYKINNLSPDADGGAE